MASGMDVANRAQAEMREIGGQCGNNNKYTHWYSDNVEGSNGYNFWWCAAFVSYVVRAVGVPTSVVPNSCSCPIFIDWARNHGRLHPKSQLVSGAYAPQPGDIFLRDGHTGIIVSVSGSQFTTVEGNTDGTENCRTVGSHTWDFSSSHYDYVFNPDYPDKVQTMPAYSTKQFISLDGLTADRLSKMDILTEVPKLSAEQLRVIIQKHFSQSSVISVSDAESIQKAQDDTQMSALVMLSIGAQESGWGTSAIAKAKNNLWGYGAVNSNPMGGAHTYSQIGQGAAEFAREVIKDYYNGYGAKSIYAMGSGDNPKGMGYAYTDGGQIDQRWWQDISAIMRQLCVTCVNANLTAGYLGSSVEGYMYSENAYADTEKEPTVIWNNRVKENIHPKLQATVSIPSTGEVALYANGNDITKIVGDLSWKNSIYELSTTMSFSVAKSDAAYLKDLMYTPQVGDIVQYVTNEEIFRGVIIKVDDGDKNSSKYSVVDMGWYLNKTSQTYQFKNITAADAIRELCADMSINIVMLPELTENIKQIYFDKTISAILTDILDKCGGDYNYDFVPEGLRIYEIGELYAYLEFTVASNIAQAYAPDYRGGVSHSISIEEMNNSIKITSEKDSVYTELMVQQNRELIDKYGFLQKIIKIDPEKENAETIAKQELNDNAREAETFSFEIVEKYDSYTRAGEVMTVDGVRYVIESTDHRIEDGRHFDKLELRKII